MSAPRAIVVGSGIAGLSAAWRLTRAGFSVSVLDKEERPGGRVWSEVKNGFVVDKGPWLLSTHDHHLRAALRELEQGKEFCELRNAERAQLHRNGVDEIDPYEVRGVMRIPGVRFYDGLRIFRLPRLMRHYGDVLDPDQPEQAASLDFRSMSDFVGLYFGGSSLRRWAGPWLGATSLADERTASRVLFLLHVAKNLGSSPVVLRSGFAGLIRAITERVETRLGVDVTALNVSDTGEIEVRFWHSEVEERETVDAVVVATAPAHALNLSKDALSYPEEQFLAASRGNAGLCLTLGLDHAFAKNARLIQVPHSENSPIESIWVEPSGSNGRVPAGKTLVRIVATRGWAAEYMEAADDVVRKELIAAAGRVDMRFQGKRSMSDISRIPNACPSFDVGRYRELARFNQVQDDQRARGRRLYFAGDYLQGPSIEDAFVSGLRAADRCIADLQTPRP
jgi:oxygen-dependent protoporphyrinogen oxidase